MDIITPAVFNREKVNEVVEKQMNFREVMLFVGAFPQSLPNPGDTYTCLVVPDVVSAAKVITDLSGTQQKMPAAIIYGLPFAGGGVLSEWTTYFAHYPAMRSVPFFLYAERVTEPLKALVKKHIFIDDIVLKESFINLNNKIGFVSKFKKMSAFAQSSIADRRFALKNIRITRKGWNYFLKRTFDITASLTALAVLSPVMLTIAALIRLESKGGILYVSQRAGKNYRIFRFYKFRTMVSDADKQLDQLKHLNQYDTADSEAVFYKVSNDPRVTRLGKFLRNSSLDEIPQLFNVLKGDMSLVGNRPLPLYEAASLTTDDWAERFLAPAGITGLWQISKRGKHDMSVSERISLDINYTHRHCFTYDMWLMVNTPLALIQKDNV